jgi:hypothetical protein
MAKQDVIRRILKAGLFALIGIGIAAFGVESSFAYAGKCGPHCQAGRMCSDLVAKKGVKTDQRQSEYQACMRDPQNYK